MLAWAESQIVCPRKRSLTLGAGRLAETACKRKHVRHIIDEKPGYPAEKDGNEKGDVHLYHYSLKQRPKFNGNGV
jgi:hypothetical protein